MAENLKELLADLEEVQEKVSKLENEVFAHNKDPDRNPLEVWTFAKTTANKGTEDISQKTFQKRNTFLEQKQKNKRKKAIIPGVGKYDPNFTALEKTTPGYLFSRPKHSTPAIIKQRRRKPVSDREREKRRRKILQKKEEENIISALCYSSRVRSVSGSIFKAPTKENDSRQKQNLATSKNEGPGFKYSGSFKANLTKRSAPSFSFGRPPELKQEISFKKKEENENDAKKVPNQPIQDVTLLDVEKSYKFIENRACGVTAWSRPTPIVWPGQKVKESTQNQKATAEPENELNLEIARAAIEPRVLNVISWKKADDSTKQEMKTFLQNRKKSLDKDASTTVSGEILGTDHDQLSKSTSASSEGETELMNKAEPSNSVYMRTPGVPTFYKDSEPTAQLSKYREIKRKENESLGPGYYSAQNPTRRAVGIVKMLPPREKQEDKKKITTAPEGEISIYDVSTALDRTKPRVKGIPDFSKGQKRFFDVLKMDQKAQKEIEFAKSKKPETSVLEEKYESESDNSVESTSNSFEGKYADSVSSYSESEGKTDSMYSDSLSTEGKYHSSSEDDEYVYSPNIRKQAVAEEMESWFEFRRACRQKRKRERMNSLVVKPSRISCKYRENPGQSSIWSRPKHEQTLKGQKYLAFLKHKKRKEDEVKGPNTSNSIKYSAIDSRTKGIISLGKAMSSKARQDEMNEKIRVKISKKSEPKENDIMKKLGLDPKILEPCSSDDDCRNTLTQAAENHVRTFIIKKPSDIPSPLRRKLDEKLQQDQQRGPGAYESHVHKLWQDNDNKAKELLDNVYATQKRLNSYRNDPSATDDKVNELKAALTQAKQQWNRYKESQPLNKSRGRETVKVKSKGSKLLVPFGTVPKIEEDIPGPGDYAISDNVTRYGLEQPRGVVDFGKMSTRPMDDVELYPEGDNLILENTERIRPKPPGASGFTFSKLERQIQPETDEHPAEGAILDLNPNYYFSTDKTGNSLVPLNKVTGREDKNETYCDEGQMLMLSPQKAEDYLKPKVKTMRFEHSGARNLLPSNPEEDEDILAKREGYMDAAYDVNTKLIKERADKHVLRMDKIKPRWPDSPDPDRPHEAADAQYDIVEAHEALKPKTSFTIDLSKQQERWTEMANGDENLPYHDADYDNVDTSKLGGRNARGVIRSENKAKKTISFAKQPERWEVKEIEHEPVLDLNPKKGEKMESKYRRVQTGVKLSLQPGRWEHEEEKEYRKDNNGPVSPIDALIQKAEKLLSIHDKSKRPTAAANLNMAKATGRTDFYPTKDHEITEIYPEKAKDAPQLNKRVTGGVFSTAKKSSSPKTKYAKEKARQGNVLELNPSDLVLRERKDKNIISMSKTTGRKDDEMNVDSGNIIMTSPTKPDLNKISNFLKADVKGGHSVLKKDVGVTGSMPLQSKIKSEKIKEKQNKAEFENKIKSVKQKQKKQRRKELKTVQQNNKQKKKKKSKRSRSKKALTFPSSS